MKAKKKQKEPLSLEAEQTRALSQIGAKLKALRLEKGFSSYELFAFQNDIDRSQYGKYERGADLRISTLIKLTRALGVTLEEFFSEGFE